MLTGRFNTYTCIGRTLSSHLHTDMCAYTYICMRIHVYMCPMMFVSRYRVHADADRFFSCCPCVFDVVFVCCRVMTGMLQCVRVCACVPGPRLRPVQKKQQVWSGTSQAETQVAASPLYVCMYVCVCLYMSICKRRVTRSDIIL